MAAQCLGLCVFHGNGNRDTTSYAIPPPRISTQSDYLDIYNSIHLNLNLSVEGVRFLGNADPGRTYYIALNNYRMTVGAGGIRSVLDQGHINGPGEITSSVDYLNIHTIYNANNYGMAIGAGISDNYSHKVGVNIMGQGVLIMNENTDNTFTGDVNINGSALSLKKENGSIAVKGNINVNNGGTLYIPKSHQINDRSTITLNSNSINKSSQILIGSNTESVIIEKIGSLVVDDYGVIKFDRKKWNDRGFFYLNNLIINPDSILHLEEWREGYSYLLVRKDSKHLTDAWNKIRFKNINGEIGVRDYDKDYWEIGAGTGFRPLPEPATYGAALGAIALALWIRRRRRPLPPHRGKPS